MAAYELAAKGVPVIVLEARDRIGGRIHTIYDEVSGNPLELGAEFIHGDAPLTRKLMKQAAMSRIKSEGDMWQTRGGMLKRNAELIEHWGLFRKKLKELKTDRTINEFLQEQFGEDEYKSLRESVRNYASGYDTADPETASALALAKEWLSEQGDEHYRTNNGYQRLVNYIAEELVIKGGQIYTGQDVKELVWLNNRVTAITSKGETFTGIKGIITLPINVLMAETTEQGALTFSPALPAINAALKHMGMGAVIKVLLRFSEAFWKREEITKMAGKSMERANIILSQEAIPTWWTQYPGTLPLLTGWLGGPAANEMKHTSDEDLLEAAMSSLASIFKMDTDSLKGLLISWKVINWTADPYARGSYTYATVDTELARKVLMTPIDDTLYFAGEALYDGAEMGTVEAALDNGKRVAEGILDRL